MGLGLSISRAIAEMHQGSLEVHNNEGGVGCTFSVRLALPLAPPLSDAAPKKHGTSSTALTSTTDLELLRGCHCHVLAADDVLMNRVAVREMLRALGCTVDVVVDGVAAVEAVRARQP